MKPRHSKITRFMVGKTANLQGPSMIVCRDPGRPKTTLGQKVKTRGA